MFEKFSLFCLVSLFGFCAFSGLWGASSAGISLREHQNIAIATDLEPDDVLALGIIFAEANRVYEQVGGKYPIDLVIVGEGNSGIKGGRICADRVDTNAKKTLINPANFEEMR